LKKDLLLSPAFCFVSLFCYFNHTIICRWIDCLWSIHYKTYKIFREKKVKRGWKTDEKHVIAAFVVSLGGEEGRGEKGQ
jgi:hypothetical protein